jgi:hypothetical protein
LELLSLLLPLAALKALLVSAGVSLPKLNMCPNLLYSVCDASGWYSVWAENVSTGT